jgi:hypothetical protein
MYAMCPVQDGIANVMQMALASMKAQFPWLPIGTRPMKKNLMSWSAGMRLFLSSVASGCG